MKLELFLCAWHAPELQKRFGTDAVNIKVRPRPHASAYCVELSCLKKMNHAEFEVIFDTEKVASDD